MEMVSSLWASFTRRNARKAQLLDGYAMASCLAINGHDLWWDRQFTGLCKKFDTEILKVTISFLRVAEG